MRKAPEKVAQLVRDTVLGMDYELVGVELASGRKGDQTLRIYIDKPEGIQLDDCAAVSHQLSGVLDVEDPIRDAYALEVSSPGLDRPLFELEHFQRYLNHDVRIRLGRLVNGRRNFRGLIRQAEGDVVQIEMEGEFFDLPLDAIDTARLVPEF